MAKNRKTSAWLIESHPEYNNHWFGRTCKSCEVIDKTIANEKRNEEFYKTYKPTVMRWTINTETGMSSYTPLDENGNLKTSCRI